MHLQHTSSENECIITFANFYEFFESAMEKKKKCHYWIQTVIIFYPRTKFIKVKSEISGGASRGCTEEVQPHAAHVQHMGSHACLPWLILIKLVHWWWGNDGKPSQLHGGGAWIVSWGEGAFTNQVKSLTQGFTSLYTSELSFGLSLRNKDVLATYHSSCWWKRGWGGGSYQIVSYLLIVSDCLVLT